MLSVTSLTLICVTIGSWAFSFGLGTQAVSHSLAAQGVDDSTIGLTHSFYYFGMAVASCLAPRLSLRLGVIGCVSIGLVLTSITLVAFPWVGEPWCWHALRFINGWAGAMCIIPLEALISRDTRPARRTQALACFGVGLTLGGALGMTIAPQLYPFGYPRALLIGGAVSLAAACVIIFGVRKQPEPEVKDETPAPVRVWEHSLSFGTAWGQGFLEGTLVAFLALFLEHSRAFGAADAGLLMGITTLGVVFFQVPVSWLADRFGATPILLGCYAAVVAGLIAIPVVTHFLAMGILLLLFGACTGAMYPLGLSLLGERIPPGRLARACAWYLVIECIGCQLGAAVAGLVRAYWRDEAMFHVALAAVLLVVLVWFLSQALARQGLAEEETPRRFENHLNCQGRRVDTEEEPASVHRPIA